MEIRSIAVADREALATFFTEIPEGDRTFFKEDIGDDQVVRAWSEPRPGEERLVAVDSSGAIAGWAALSRGVGWSDHVGDLRLAVIPSRRRQGLGRRLAQHALLASVRRGYSKLVVELVSDAAISMFEDLGFQPEALLLDHVRDRDGRLRDLVVLAYHVQCSSDDLAAVGIDRALGTDASWWRLRRHRRPPRSSRRSRGPGAATSSASCGGRSRPLGCLSTRFQ